MFIVTLPSGKTYTYKSEAGARALAARTGGSITVRDEDGDRARDARREAGLSGRPGKYDKYGPSLRMW